MQLWERHCDTPFPGRNDHHHHRICHHGFQYVAAVVEDDPSAPDDDRRLCRQYRRRYKGIPCADPLQGDPQGAVHDDPSPDGEKIKMDGHNLSHETLRSTNVYMTAYFIVLFVSLLIVCLDEYDLSTNFTAVLATLNNIGPGLELVGPTQNFALFSPLSKCVLMFDMLAGRLELFPMLVILLPSCWKKY